MTLHLIAMHGWAGDQRGWAPLSAASEMQGWLWNNGERGYGALPPAMPTWAAGRRRVLVVHSLGLHLVPEQLLAAAEAVVLLASFGRFVPQGAAGRRLHAALSGMTTSLEGPDAEAMVCAFLTRAADPTPVDVASMGIADGPLSPTGRQRLRADLDLLAATAGLPPAFPRQARVLIVEAGNDRIVVPEAREQLRDALPSADLLHLAAAGHCLMNPCLVPMLIGWLGELA
jgi:pimeloyl-[acyl-carrier protein] methyl ester esterase